VASRSTKSIKQSVSKRKNIFFKRAGWDCSVYNLGKVLLEEGTGKKGEEVVISWTGLVKHAR